MVITKRELERRTEDGREEESCHWGTGGRGGHRESLAAGVEGGSHGVPRLGTGNKRWVGPEPGAGQAACQVFCQSLARAFPPLDSSLCMDMGWETRGRGQFSAGFSATWNPTFLPHLAWSLTLSPPPSPSWLPPPWKCFQRAARSPPGNRVPQGSTHSPATCEGPAEASAEP